MIPDAANLALTTSAPSVAIQPQHPVRAIVAISAQRSATSAAGSVIYTQAVSGQVELLKEVG